MDALTFSAELVKATAWPITTVVVAILFRTEFRALLGRLRKGKVGSAEFEFQKEIKELKNDIAEISTARVHVVLKPEVVSLAILNPRAALLSAWIEIEASLINLAQKHKLLNNETLRNPIFLVRILTKANLIPKSHGPLFTALRQLRDQAAHEFDFNPSVEAVLGYLEMAEELNQLILAS